MNGSLRCRDYFHGGLRHASSKFPVALARIVQVIRNVFPSAVLTVVEVVGIYPSETRIGPCDFDLDVANHGPMGILLIVHIEVTESSDDEDDVVATEVFA